MKNLKEILFAIFFTISAIFGFYKMGQNTEKNKSYEKKLKQAKENSKFRKKLGSISNDAKRDYLHKLKSK